MAPFFSHFVLPTSIPLAILFYAFSCLSLPLLVNSLQQFFDMLHFLSLSDAAILMAFSQYVEYWLFLFLRITLFWIETDRTEVLPVV